MTKNVFLDSYSSIKKFKKYSDHFWHRKFDFESQNLALFDTSPLHQFAKVNDFIWLQLIFSQKTFLILKKLHNWYCHTWQSSLVTLYCFDEIVKWDTGIPWISCHINELKRILTDSSNSFTIFEVRSFCIWQTEKLKLL